MTTLELLKVIDREVYQERIQECVNILATIDDALKEFEIRLFCDGLSYDDYENIKNYINILWELDYRIKIMIAKHIRDVHDKSLRYNDEIRYQKYILKIIGTIGSRLYEIYVDLKKELGLYTLKDLVKDNSSLLHLVSTNNHSNQAIKKVSDDAFMYVCQFHNERIPSMRVNNHKNRLYCYGCGASLDIFHYLSEYEGISLDDSLFLLSEINKISIPNNPFNKSDEIVRKYTCASALRRYEKRLDSCYNRTIHKNKTFNNYLALKKISQEKESIRRIRNNEYLEIPEQKNSKVLKYLNPFEEREY